MPQKSFERCRPLAFHQKKTPLTFERYRALVSPLPILAFPSSALHLTCWTTFQATKNQVWQLLGSSYGALWTTCILKEFFLFKNRMWTFRESSPWIWQTSIHIDVPIIVNTAFLQHIKICLSSPGHINVFQWSWKRFFFRHMELNSRFHVMTINEVTFDWPEVFPSFRVIFCFCRLRPSEMPWSFLLWDLHSSQVVPASEWVLGLRGLSKPSKQFCCSICGWESESFLSLWR